MTVTEKKELTRFLKRGDKKRICKMAGVHETVMYAWITDRLKTSSIEPFVIELSSQRRREFEMQTNSVVLDQSIDHYELTLQNIRLKEELKHSCKQLSTFQKLVSGKNKIYNQLFLRLKELISQSDLTAFQKSVFLDTLLQIQSDFAFISRYKRYAEILSSINPILAKSFEKLKVDLSDHEKQLLSLIKLNLTDHEIALILAVSDQAIETDREMLKFKLSLNKKSNLNDFVNSL